LRNETDETKNAWEISGLFIPAGLLIGLGIGWAMGHIVPGLFVGLGGGFVGMAIARIILSKK